jgi:hypothetical protein
MVVDDFGGAKVLDRMLLYERRIEHSLYRTMGELQRLRRMRGSQPPTIGATPERGSACCRKGVASLKSGVSSGRCGLQTSRFTLSTAEETPYGVTTNGVATSTEPPVNPRSEGETSVGRVPAACAALPSRPVEAVGEESEGDCAKQSQSGADQIVANLGRYNGLRQEACPVLPEEQSQDAGDLVLHAPSFSHCEQSEAASHPPV